MKLRFRRADGIEIELEGTEAEVGEKIDSLFNRVSPLFPNGLGSLNSGVTKFTGNRNALSQVIIEKDGLPVISAKVGSRKGVGLVLYPERTLSPEQLERSLGLSGIPTKGRFLLSRLSELRKNGYLVKNDDGTWGLTPLGRKWIEEKIAPSLGVEERE